MNCGAKEHAERNYSTTLSVEGISMAKKHWIKIVQMNAFPKGVKEELLLWLSPTVDMDGMSR